MRPDAVLTPLSPSTRSGARGGRPSKRGKRLAKPEAIAVDDSRSWLTCEVFVYGRRRILRYKPLCAQWYRACGTRLLRIVVVATDREAGRFASFSLPTLRSSAFASELLFRGIFDLP
jgi:hypothetical protein